MSCDTESFHQDDGYAFSNQELIAMDKENTTTEKSASPFLDSCSHDTEVNDGKLSEAKETNGADLTWPVSGESFRVERDLNDQTVDGTASKVNEDDSSSDNSSSSSSSSSSDDESESEDESACDPHLSDYERLRLRNIRRNEARLAQLGLLIPRPQSQRTLRPFHSQSALATLLHKSGQKREGRPSGGGKKATKIVEVTRILPRRVAKSTSRHDRLSYESIDKKDRTKTSPVEQCQVLARQKNAEYDDDDSIPPSPIQLSKIIKPQSHQKDFHEDKKLYLKQRRNRRGRPKRDEYVYVCEEVCSYCGGEWGNVIETVDDGDGGEIESEATKKDTIVAIELLDDDEVKLIRCKDCREAFHPRCMLLGEKESEKNSNGSTILKQAKPDGEIASLTMNDDYRLTTAAEKSVLNLTEEDESMDEGITSGASRDRITTWSANTSTECDLTAKDNITNTLSPHRYLVASTHGEEPVGKVPITYNFPCRHPKRCRACETIRKVRLEQGDSSGGKHTRESSNDIGTSVKRRCTLKLEAFIGEKRVLCSVEPAPLLEAVVSDKSIACFITLAGIKLRSNTNMFIDDMVTGRTSEVVKGIQKRKRQVSFSNAHDVMTKKITKIVSKASGRIGDAKVQEASIITLRSYVDGKSTTAVLRAGGLDVLFSAMSYHLMLPNVQVESIKTMTEIVWYCQSLGTELVKRGCLGLTISAMDCHGTHSEVQKMGCELFRALSYDLECCNAMFKANVVAAVVASMARNPKELDTLTEGSCFIQNMIVVSFDTVNILLKGTRGDDIISVLINGIQENQGVDFVVAACDVLANLAQDKRGQSRLIRMGCGAIFHELIKINRDFPEVAQPAMLTLYNLACNSSTLLKDLAMADCTSSIIALLNHSTRNPLVCSTSLGFLKKLAGANNDAILKISSQSCISMVLDAIQHCHLLELQLNAFSLLGSIPLTDDRQVCMNAAKRILESMHNFPDEEAIQSGGCQILRQVMRAHPQSRALKSLFRSGSGRQILSSVMKAYPKSCKDDVDRLLYD
ncbi:hypothetical protein ACHAWX_004211 [Stephanocyclus meneghinianus]